MTMGASDESASSLPPGGEASEGGIVFQHFRVAVVNGRPQELGRGAMGVTYRAIDGNLRMPVALKVINAALLETSGARERFLREARSAAALRHPNVASVFFLGEQDGCVFYAMEFVEGETVEARIRSGGAMPADLALKVVTQVAAALTAAEKEGIVHRDIKPSNIMLSRAGDGELLVKVIDFGLAKSIETSEDAATITQGGFLGTPHFASPEQLEEGDVDTRSDIYSLGVTLFYMLAGRTPFSGSMAQVMSQHLHRPPPLELLPPQPAVVQDLLTAMLAKDPGQRPANAAELRRRAEVARAALGADETERTVVAAARVATDQPAISSSSEPARVRPKWLLAGLVGVLLTGGALAILHLVRSPGEVVDQSSAAPSPTPSVTPVSTPVLAATPTPRPYEAQVALARELESEASPEAALLAYAKLAEDHPQDASLFSAMERMAARVETQHPEGIDAGDFARLRPALEAAARGGSPSAEATLGKALRPSEPVTALHWLQAAARQGRTDAMVLAGLMIADGKGVSSPDPSAAIAWFEAAARGNDADGMTFLADCYLRGVGVEPDPKRAVALLDPAAALGNPRALGMLARLYERGIGVGVDPKRALELYRQAAQFGNLDAQANLGVLTIRGVGRERDPQEAVRLWREGAEQGNPTCMFFYAQSIADPDLGNDPAKAQEWFIRAARSGSEDAVDWCQREKIEWQALPAAADGRR